MTPDIKTYPAQDVKSLVERLRYFANELAGLPDTTPFEPELLHDAADALDALSLPQAVEPEKRAPVQGYAAGIPWSLHLRAYDAYCAKYRPQPALIDLEGRGCRGGFSVGELDMFVPGWREEVAEITALKACVAELEARPLYAHPQAAGDWQSLSCEEQHALATRIAQNVGYVLTPEPGFDDEDDAHPAGDAPSQTDVAAKQVRRWLRESGVAGARFDHSQSSDETGEYHTTEAKLFSNGDLWCDLLTGEGHWSSEDFEAVALAVNNLPRWLAALSAQPTPIQAGGDAARQEAITHALKALGDGVRWFSEYAEHHAAKGDGEKAGRNTKRAARLKGALTSLQAVPFQAGGDVVGALEDALKPFAQAVEDFEGPHPDHMDADGYHIWESGLAMNITFGDFRRARQALAALAVGKGE